MMYSDDIGNRCCCQIMFNAIKHICIDIFLKKFIETYKDIFLTFLLETGDESTEQGSTPVVLNYDDVNREFGWALMKLKKKYATVKHTSEH